MIPNFLSGSNLNLREITGVHRIKFLGESVSVVSGVPNPWMLLSQLSLLVLIVFVVDAAVKVWRRGDRRQSIIVGGSAVLFLLGGVMNSVLVFWGIVRVPIMPSFFFAGIVAAMGYELSCEVLRAAQLARELRESEQRMSLAAEATNLGLWIREFAGDKIWANDQCRALFGFTKTQPLNFAGLLLQLHAEDRLVLRRAIENAVQSGELYETEYRVMLPDGQVRWITSRGRVEFGDDGKPVRLRGASVDVTHRKQAEQQSQAHRDEVAHLLRVASLGELSSALAHELNQPLAAILSNAQAAQRFLTHANPDPKELRAILLDIVSDNQRASAVIRRLRAFLKKNEFQPQRLELNELLKEVINLLNFELTARAVSVDLQPVIELPSVRGDRVQLQQVLINLILNASHAMTQTDKARRLTLRAGPAENEILLVSVADTGGGVAPGTEEKIFEPYHTTKRNGLGLGLSLSRSIVEAHGGRLWMENKGEGAVFQFTLPQWKEETT